MTNVAMETVSMAEPREAPADPLRFVFAGITFEVHPSPELAWTLAPDHRLFRTVPDDGPVFGRVDCVVAAAPELSAEHGREISWAWDGDVARVATSGARVEIRGIGEARYAATALVSPDARGCSSLCTALAGAVAQREGALVLHASGIELDEGAILFVGPSGAGKTTAANQCAGARWFARDRAVVFPTPSGWYATAMCGGDPIDLPRSPQRLLPLRGILRVRRGAERAEIAELGGAGGLLALRESLQTARQDADGEGQALETLWRLCGESRVAELRSVLGSDLTDTLRGWIGR